VKLFAATVSAAFLLTLSLTTAPLSSAAPQKPAKTCRKPPREKKARLCSATIYEVAEGTVPAGYKVQIANATVTAIAPAIGTAWLGAESTDPGYEGPAYSGLEVSLSGVSPQPELQVGGPAAADAAPAVGDRVTVDGTTYGGTTGNWLAATSLQVTSSGASVTPTEVNAATFASTSEAAPLDAVLVRVPNLTLVSQTEPEWTMSGGIRLSEEIMGELPVGTFLDGAEFEYVTGIADTLGSGPRLVPRSLADFHVRS
jgi:hypothetical protein